MIFVCAVGGRKDYTLYFYERREERYTLSFCGRKYGSLRITFFVIREERLHNFRLCEEGGKITQFHFM